MLTAIIKSIAALAVAALIAWQIVHINSLKAWQKNVIAATSVASDARDAQDNLVIIDKQDVALTILALGRAITDTRLQTQIARVDDAQNALTRERADALTTKGIVDDYNLKIASARNNHGRSIKPQPSSVQSDAAATTAERGGRGADLPALSNPARSADDAAAQARLSDPARLSASDALICTEQAIGFDALRGWVSAQAVLVNGAEPTALPD